MRLSPEEIIEKLTSVLGSHLLSTEIRERFDGYLNKQVQRHIYLKVERDAFHKTLYLLKEITPLHAACPMARKETEDSIELIYSLSIYFATERFAEIPIVISVILPKNDLNIRSCTDIIPGLIIMEMEAKEMLGIEFEGLPDKRRFFTGDYLKEGSYPHRKDFMSKQQESDSK